MVYDFDNDYRFHANCLNKENECNRYSKTSNVIFLSYSSHKQVLFLDPIVYCDVYF